MAWLLGGLCDWCVAMIELITMKEAAARFGVDVSTIKRWKDEGNLEYLQPNGKGGKVRIIWRNEWRKN